MKTKTGSNLGFTLVELLVVISIIALLLSILMPSLSRAREQGKRIVCGNRIKQTGIAQIAWSMDNKGFATPIFRGTNGKDADLYGIKGDFFEVGPLWTDLLVKDKYVVDRNFFRCPSGNPTAKTIAALNIAVQYHSMFTYGLCRANGAWISWKIDSGTIVRKDGKTFDGVSLSKMRASEFILAGDSVSTYPDYKVLYGPYIQFYYMELFTPSAVTNPALRHLKTGVFLMADGSVAISDDKQLVNAHKVIARNVVTIGK